ncbi:MAG: hypothetical protein DMG76_21245 [Acidobacteria bacterium]|nr:MAG: hypothetical protein DMG76_21245 [Acidobacteriota bacterium]
MNVLRRADYGTSEFHLFLTDVVEDATSTVSPKLNWYMARAVDGTPTFSEAGQFGSYVKLLRVMSYAFITPRDPTKENWVGTQVGEQGTLAGPQTIKTESFWPLVESRVRALESAPATMTERQREKFEEMAMRDPEKFLKSESARVVLANRKLEQRMAAKYRRPIQMRGRDRNQPCPCGSGIFGRIVSFSPTPLPLDFRDDTGLSPPTADFAHWRDWRQVRVVISRRGHDISCPYFVWWPSIKNMAKSVASGSAAS